MIFPAHSTRKSVVQDVPIINKIVLWSDSCVAQNKNRVNTTMTFKFLQDNPNIESIIPFMRFFLYEYKRIVTIVSVK